MQVRTISLALHVRVFLLKSIMLDLIYLNLSWKHQANIKAYKPRAACVSWRSYRGYID